MLSQADMMDENLLGDLVRTNKLDDGTVVSWVYECKACGGAGGADHSRDVETYDDWQDCTACDGTGELEIDD